MLNQELETRVIERTSELRTAVEALETQIAERQRLEREILEIGERENHESGRTCTTGFARSLPASLSWQRH